MSRRHRTSQASQSVRPKSPRSGVRATPGNGRSADPMPAPVTTSPKVEAPADQRSRS